RGKARDPYSQKYVEVTLVMPEADKDPSPALRDSGFQKYPHFSSASSVPPCFKGGAILSQSPPACCAAFFATSIHAGNGRREESRNASISSRTFDLRSTIAATSRSSAGQSWPAHSGGIMPAISRMTPASKFSMRWSHGSNDSQPEIFS